MAVVSRHEISEAVSRVGANPILALGIIIALLYWARVFFITFASAVAIAFILEPFVGLLLRIRFPRPLASFFVCSLALLAVYLIGLGAYSQVAGLVSDFEQDYSPRAAEAVNSVRDRIEGMERRIYQLVVPARQQQMQQQADASRKKKKKADSQTTAPPAPPAPPAIPEVRIYSDRAPITEYFYSRLGSVYQFLLMSSFVPFLVYFMLSWRDHIYRSFLQFFEGEDRSVAAKSLEGIGAMVRAFVVGNFGLGIILTMASSLVFWKLGLPYPLLVGPLSGFLSLVPYIGLPLALIPPLLVTVTTAHALSFYLVIAAVVTLFHVVALNLLYPKLVGSRVHLNPLVVTVAMMFWGFLWDAAGLVLAIPLTAGIKAVCDNVKSLQAYGNFLGD
ncbi:MAG: AI-2E family transporter [Bryobacteraceae bacterium]